MSLATEDEFVVKRASPAQIELPCSTRDPTIRADLLMGRGPREASFVCESKE